MQGHLPPSPTQSKTAPPIMLSSVKGKIPYKEVEYSEMSHWGQRKLLLSEIEFLSKYSRSEDIVVYAGAAPGIHIPYLSELFPELSFILVDPGRFGIKETEKIKIINGYFNEKIISTLPKNLLFISDIRRKGIHDCDSVDEYDRLFQEDMELQQEWIEMMRPLYSFVKFKLSFNSGSTEYLKGKIYLPVFGRQGTSEARLLVSSRDNFEKILYDNKEYEEKMAYFNQVIRTLHYNFPLPVEEQNKLNIVGLDNCYDCCREIMILSSYLDSKRADEISIMSHDITNHLNKMYHSTRNLGTKVSKNTRKDWTFCSHISPKVYIPSQKVKSYVNELL